jgi:hypothetical protein
MTIPNIISSYMNSKNQHDIKAMLENFEETATVYDDGKIYKGKEAIGLWIEETTKAYKVTVEPISIAEKDSWLQLKALVSGNFKSSPLEFTYKFKLGQSKIQELKIGL